MNERWRETIEKCKNINMNENSQKIGQVMKLGNQVSNYECR